MEHGRAEAMQELQNLLVLSGRVWRVGIPRSLDKDQCLQVLAWMNTWACEIVQLFSRGRLEVGLSRAADTELPCSFPFTSGNRAELELLQILGSEPIFACDRCIAGESVIACSKWHQTYPASSTHLSM